MRTEVVTTAGFSGRRSWVEQIAVIPAERRSAPAAIAATIRAARGSRVVVLDGGGSYRDRMSAAVLARMRNPPEIVMMDATWGGGGGGFARLARRAAFRAFDGSHVTYCVLSSFERDVFPRQWNIPPDRVRFTPFYYGLSDSDLGAAVSEDGFAFAGGDSLRDYDTLLAAAHGTDAPLRVASKQWTPEAVPVNLTVGRVSPQEFTDMTRRASVVVVPLRVSQDRSAGQLTYLNAMALGKPVVVTDAPGVRDYIRDGETGLIVPPGDAAALRSAIAWCIAPETADDARRMGLRAQEDLLPRLGPENYVAVLLAIVDEALVRSRGRATSKRDQGP